jgi:hypothetical protein
VFFNTNALPRIIIGADVWGESSIMTGVYQRWCSSTLHIGWRLCDRVCLVLVCRGKYGLGGFFSSFWDQILYIYIHIYIYNREFRQAGNSICSILLLQCLQKRPCLPAKILGWSSYLQTVVPRIAHARSARLGAVTANTQRRSLPFPPTLFSSRFSRFEGPA